MQLLNDFNQNCDPLLFHTNKCAMIHIHQLKIILYSNCIRLTYIRLLAKKFSMMPDECQIIRVIRHLAQISHVRRDWASGVVGDFPFGFS